MKKKNFFEKFLNERFQISSRNPNCIIQKFFQEIFLQKFLYRNFSQKFFHKNFFTEIFYRNFLCDFQKSKHYHLKFFLSVLVLRVCRPGPSSSSGDAKDLLSLVKLPELRQPLGWPWWQPLALMCGRCASKNYSRSRQV